MGLTEHRASFPQGLSWYLTGTAGWLGLSWLEWVRGWGMFFIVIAVGAVAIGRGWHRKFEVWSLWWPWVLASLTSAQPPTLSSPWKLPIR